MPQLERPLNPDAVRAADEALRAETGGRALTMGPEDAALRKKWVDAYLAAGGKPAKKVPPRLIKSPSQPCPFRNWVELEYLYPSDKPVPCARYTVKAEGGVLASGTLDNNGFAHVGGIPVSISSVTYFFNDDPPPYRIFPEFKPIVNPLPAPQADFFDRVTKLLQEADDWDWSGLEGVWDKVAAGGEWVWGTIQGDFNDEPDMGQVVLATVIALIPVVQQVADVRDLVADLKKLIWEKRYDDFWVWFAVVVTLISCIPEIGSVIKGVLKALKIEGQGLKLAKLLRHLNWMGEGNAVRWLKELVAKLPEHGRVVASKFKEILTHLSSRLERLRGIAGAKMGPRFERVLEAIRQVQSRVDKMVDEVIQWAEKRIRTVLDEGERVEKQGATQTKNTLQQEKEAIPGHGPKPPLRLAYEAEVRAMADKAKQMRAEGKSSEEIARALQRERREIGIKYKDLTPPDLLEKIRQRNLEKYGDELGPSIEYLRDEGKSWDDIIQSAIRPGGKDLF